MCAFGADIGTALIHNGVHADDAGHSELAAIFERRLAKLRWNR
jgi:hypothetical protein